MPTMTTERPEITPDLLTIPQAAQRLGVGRDRIYALLADGELRSVHLGRSHRVVGRSVDEYIERQATDER